MKILYITYENVYRTGILQAMVLKPIMLMSEKYGIRYVVTSSVKKNEKDELYRENKQHFNNLKREKIRIVEFEKNLTEKQSIFTFMNDILKIVMFSIKEARISDCMHCRSYGGALIGLIVSFIVKRPYIFDMRGTLPEETVEVGKISIRSIKYKLMKIAEKILIKRASYILTVSNRFNHYIKENFKKENTININNPTDFNMFYRGKRNPNRVTFIYSGSLQLWHLPELTIEYYSKIYDIFGDKVYLYFCVNDGIKAKGMFKKYNISDSSYEINAVPFNQMPRYYAKSDIAFCFIRNSFPKSVCFPVKFTEYIASELFVLANSGIGDIEYIIKKHNCGLVFENLEEKYINIQKIAEVVKSILDDKYVCYDRKNLSFLDWNSKGIENIHDVYIKVAGKKECTN